MTLNSTYSPLALSPKVLLYNRDGTLAYTFESAQIDASPTQDFNLIGYNLKDGINDNYGSLVLTIADHSDTLIDDTVATRPSLIEREGSVQFFLGKDSTTLSRWFYGKVKEVQVDRRRTGLTYITVICVGWGVVLRERLTRMVRYQKKTSDGETMDTTDTSTSVYNLVHDLFEDKDHYIDENIAILANISLDKSRENLISGYKFDDDVTDMMGANNGTVTGTSTYVAGVHDKAFSFNGSTYITLANETNFDLDRTNAMSFSFWYNSSSSLDKAIFVKAKSASDYSGIWIEEMASYSPSGSGFGFALYDGAGITEISRTNNVRYNDGLWHHIVWTYDGSNTVAGIKFYIDGVLTSTTIRNNVAPIGTILHDQPAVIGGVDIDGAYAGTFKLDDVQIWSSELTYAEVLREYYNNTGVCEECLSTQLANINLQPGVSFAEALNTLTGISKTSWHVDYDRVLNIGDGYDHDSGFLFTNDMESTKTLNWNGEKLGYIKNAPIVWSDSSADSYYTYIHGIGHFSSRLSSSDGQTPDSLDTQYNIWNAIPFTATTDNIYKIAVRLARTGTPATNHKIEIWGDDGTGKPDPSDIRRTIRLSKEKLQALGTSAPSDWMEVSIRPKLEVTKGETLFIVVPIYGSASHTINMNYKSGTGTYYDSPDGVTWTSRTGKMSYRIYEAKRMVTTFENTTTRSTMAEVREKIYPVRADLEEETVRQMMFSVGEILSKQKRTYENIMVTPVTSRIPLNQYCQVVDVKTGLEFKAIITAFNISAYADTPSDRLGATQMTVTLEDFDYT